MHTVFRIGKSIENFRSALQTIHLTNPMLRLLVTMVRICRGFYLLLDHVLWAARMRLVSIDNRFWSRLSNWCWMAAIIFSLLRDVYDLLVALRVERNRLQHCVPPSSSSSPSSHTTGQLLAGIARGNPNLIVDMVKNAADALIPAYRLDLVTLPGGLVGLLGVVSALAGLLPYCDPQLKLKFS